MSYFRYPKITYVMTKVKFSTQMITYFGDSHWRAVYTNVTSAMVSIIIGANNIVKVGEIR